MISNMKADTFRVLKKKSFYVTSIIILALFLITFLLSKVFTSTEINLTESFTAFTAIPIALFPFLVGLPIFIAVFTDDFKSHAMQIAIGRGLSRNKLILCRFTEVLILFAAISVVSTALIAILSLIMRIPANLCVDLIWNLLEGDLLVICYTCISMIFVYLTQNTVLALIILILFVANVIDLILTGISMIPFFQKIHLDLSAITPSSITSSAEEGKPYLWLLLVLFYIVVPILLSMIIFRKKELEF